MKEIILNTKWKTSPNHKKYSALVDDEDYERVSKYNWSICRVQDNVYAMSCINNKMIKMHVFIMGFKGVDHKDMNGLNNQKHNLRKATAQQNAMNRNSHKNSSSKFKGVSWQKSNSKWKSEIRLNYKSTYLGSFNSEIEAAQAYNNKAIELFGEFAKLNQL